MMRRTQFIIDTPVQYSTQFLCPLRRFLCCGIGHTRFLYFLSEQMDREYCYKLKLYYWWPICSLLYMKSHFPL